MDLISSLLQKYKDIRNSDLEIKKKVCLEINNTLNTSLKESDLIIKDGVVLLPQNSILKSEILIHKSNLLNKLNADLNTKIIDFR